MNDQRQTSTGSGHLSVTEAAHELGVSDETVRNHCARGNLRYFRVGRIGTRIINADDVLRLKLAQREANR